MTKILERLSIRACSRGLQIAVVAIGALVSLATFETYRLVSTVEKDWSIHRHSSAEDVRALGAVIEAAGYGGLIHQFKNYVIRRDAKRIEKVKMNGGAALGALDRLDVLSADPEIRASIDAVRQVVQTYIRAVETAHQMVDQGASPRQIDAAVKIDDGPALAALDLMLSRIAADKDDAVSTKSAQISAMRRALGYGGMIHQFKNYVLRGDAPRIAKVEGAIERFNQAVAGYLALGASADEKRALNALGGVVADYQANLSIAAQAIANGAAPEAVDAQIKVNDAPALRALTELDRAVAAEMAVYDAEISADLIYIDRISVFIAIASALLLGALALVISLILTKGVTRPAAHIAGEIEKLAAGDLNIDTRRFHAGTEMGKIAEAAQIFRQNLEQNRRMVEEREAAEAQSAKRRAMREDLQNELQRVVKAALDGDFSLRIDKNYDADLNDQARLIGDLMENFERGISEVDHVVGNLSRGELGARMKGFDRGAFGALQQQLNTTMDMLQSMVRDIQTSATSTAEAAGQIAEGAAQNSMRAESQAGSLEQTAANMEEMSATIQANADGAAQADSSAKEAASRATRGGQIVREAVAAVERIEESSGKISEIISVIDSIAFQTNLLALNAAVEAARAGDAGKGFAVVASEVRTLAERSSEAAKDISGLIDNSAKHVSDGVRLVHSTGEALETINASISEVATSVDAIAVASRQQSASVAEVTSAIAEMEQVTQHNASQSEQSAGSAKKLADEVQNLRALVSFFRSCEDASAGAHSNPLAAASA